MAGLGHEQRPVGIRLTGRFAVSLDGVDVPAHRLGSRRARQLLKLLAVQRRNTVGTDQIVTVLWPDEPPRRPEPSVATLVSRLRAVLGRATIDGDRTGYRLAGPPAVEVDIDVATALLAEAERRGDAEPGVAASAAGRALALLEHPALEEEPDATWAEPVRAERAALLRRARHSAAGAALAVGDPGAAVRHAEAAIADDQFDEDAYRDLMAGHHAAGRPAAAIAAYERLRALLAEELGIDPARSTRELHLAILREDTLPAAPALHPVTERGGTTLAGRTDELARLRAVWADVSRGSPRAVLIVGEAGIGKTRLAEELARDAANAGAWVLPARCYESERALFLQPVVDAISPVLARLPAAQVADLTAGEAETLADVLPVVGAILGRPHPAERAGPIAFRNRRAFESVTALLTRFARGRPVLLMLDDLQLAGRSCLDLLHYLIRHAGTAPVMVLATARTEEADGIRGALAGRLDELDLGPLGRAAVHRLAAAAGQAAMTDRIMQQTSGHPLYVVEMLDSIRAGSGELPISLRSSILDRVRRLGDDAAALVRAAAVVGTSFDPPLLAALLDVPPQSANRWCERALDSRLFVVTERRYEFAHDLVREVVYASTPAPTRAAHHLRAADLLHERPEAVAAHASAAGDLRRAARAWLLAAEDALRSLAAADADGLATRAVDVAREVELREVEGRALLARGRARQAAGGYQAAHADLVAAVAIAQAAGDQRLEMTALRELGGDVSGALGIPTREYIQHLERALRIARSLGDRAGEAELLDWIAVLATNRLAFADAVTSGQQALLAARACGDERALTLALDGLKTPYAYLGEVGPLAEVIAELEPRLRSRRDLFLLQWTVFESAFVPLAAGRYDEAEALMAQAIEISRHSGYVTYECFMLAHLGWLARLRGDPAAALEHGRLAVDRADWSAHAWWTVAARSMLAITLLDAGEPEEAAALLEPARSIASRGCAESYLLRCLAPLALATGSREILDDADALLATVDCPAGSAWLLGADAYVSVARAWLRHGEPARAAGALAPLLAAARRVPWVPLVELAEPIERDIAAATTLQ